MRCLAKILACGGLLLAVAGCTETLCSLSYCNPTTGTPPAAELAAPVVAADAGPSTTATVQDVADVKYYRSDEPLRMAIEHFNRGNYGIAERYFRDAVEKAPEGSHRLDRTGREL